MTVTSQTTKVTTAGNGSSFTYSFSPMVIFASTDIVVTSTVIATGVETTLVEGTGAAKYSVGITTYPATGSITYPQDEVTAVASTANITVKRTLTLEQQTDLNNQGGYFADTQETQFDKLLMIDLQQQEDIDRSFKLPVSYSGSLAATIPSDVAASAGNVMGLNTGKTALEWLTPNSSTYLTIPLPVASGGTGSITASAARTALGVAIGSNVQAYAAALDAVSGTNTGDEVTSSETVEGIIELATQTEVNAGTDALRAVTPDTLEAATTVLHPNVDDTLTGGFGGTDDADGTKTTGTYTPTYVGGNFKTFVHGAGAFTLAPQSGTGTIILLMTNASASGAVTTSGYTIVSGDTIDQTGTNSFMLYSSVLSTFKHLHVVAMQ